MEKKKKLFLGRSPLLTEQGGKVKDFYAHASTEAQGTRFIQRKINKERGYIPSAIVPSLKVTEVVEKA